MATKAEISAIHGWFELIQSYGPTLGGYAIALGAFALTAVILGAVAKAYSRLVLMSESLRETMRKERDKCEEECRRKDEIIRQLAEQHSFARNQFLAEAREREEIHQRQLRQLADMALQIQQLSTALEAARNAKRRTDL